MPTTTLIFMRHGESEANLNSVFFAGDEDRFPLTQNGRQQAQLAAQRLSTETIHASYFSPVYRARQTHEIVISHHPTVAQTMDPRLREVHTGSNEGTGTIAAQNDYKVAQDEWAKGNFHVPVGDGETGSDLRGRFEEFCKDIIAKHENERVLVVAHQALLRWGVTILMPHICTQEQRNWKLVFADPFFIEWKDQKFSWVEE